jgi:hypothetical protein
MPLLALLPDLAKFFIHPRLPERFPILRDPTFCNALHMLQPNAHFLADHITRIIPPSWKRCGAVVWTQAKAGSKASAAARNPSKWASYGEATTPPSDMLLYVMWTFLASESAAALEALADWPIMPVVCGSTRVLLQPRYLPLVFMTFPSNSQDADREACARETTRLGEIAKLDFTDALGIDEVVSKSAWVWTESSDFRFKTAAGAAGAGAAAGAAGAAGAAAGAAAASVATPMDVDLPTAVPVNLNDSAVVAAAATTAAASATVVTNGGGDGDGDDNADSGSEDSQSDRGANRGTDRGGDMDAPADAPLSTVSWGEWVHTRFGVPVADGSIFDARPAAMSPQSTYTRLLDAMFVAHTQDLHVYRCSADSVELDDDHSALLDFDALTVQDRKALLLLIMQGSAEEDNGRLPPGAGARLKRIPIFTGQNGEPICIGDYQVRMDTLPLLLPLPLPPLPLHLNLTDTFHSRHLRVPTG